MKIITRKKCVTVSEQSAEDFDRRFDEVSRSLPKSAELKWDTKPMCVHFIYEEDEKMPESVMDEYELQGLLYKCRNCPYLDKDQDRRKKKHPCKYSEYGIAYDDSPACEVFYKALRAGKLTPVSGEGE